MEYHDLNHEFLGRDKQEEHQHSTLTLTIGVDHWSQVKGQSNLGDCSKTSLEVLHWKQLFPLPPVKLSFSLLPQAQMCSLCYSVIINLIIKSSLKYGRIGCYNISKKIIFICDMLERCRLEFKLKLCRMMHDACCVSVIQYVGGMTLNISQ